MALKYAVVREDPLRDDYLRALLGEVEARWIVSGIGERPAIAHYRHFGLSSFTSGSVCVAPRGSMRLLRLLAEGATTRPTRAPALPGSGGLPRRHQPHPRAARCGDTGRRGRHGADAALADGAVRRRTRTRGAGGARAGRVGPGNHGGVSLCIVRRAHLTVRCALSLRPMPKEIPWPETDPSPSALQPRTRKPRSRWSVAIACGWRTSSTARSSNSSSRAISASATSCLPRTKSPNATAFRGRWCARRCCACADEAGHGASGAGHLRQPPARAQAQDLQRRGARQRLSARAGRCGWRWKAMPRAWRPAPHRRAVAQDRGGAPGLRRIAGAGAHVGRGRSGVPRQHRRSQRQRLLSGRAGSIHDSISGFMRLTLSLTRTGSRQRQNRAGRARHHTRGHPRAGRRARARGHAVPPGPGAAPAGGPRARLSAATGFSPPKRGTTSAEDQEQTNERFFQTQDPQDSRGTAQPSLVWREGPARVRPPFAHGADGLSPLRLRGQAGDRHHQHLERHQPLSQPLQAARGRGQARHLAGRRLSGGNAGHEPVEPFQKPTTMLYRNLLAMETEELLRSIRPTAAC